MDRVGRLMMRTGKFPFGFGHAFGNVTGNGQELLPLRGEPDGEGGTVEEHDAEPLLQRADAAAEGGLGDVPFLRGMGKALVPIEAEKVFKKFLVHVGLHAFWT